MPLISLGDQAHTINALLPVSTGAGSSALMNWIDMQGYRRLKFALLVGAITSTGSVIVTIYQSTTASSVGQTILAQSNYLTTSNGVIDINFNADALTPGCRYVQAVVSVATAAAVTGLIAFGDPNSTPPTTAPVVAQGIYLP